MYFADSNGDSCVSYTDGMYSKTYLKLAEIEFYVYNFESVYI